MEEKAIPYKFLIHCNIHQIRKGFEANIRELPFPVEIRYADLLRDGIMSDLKYTPHLIVLLLHESDSDYLLPLKVRLFAHGYPVLMVAPALPDRYFHFLKTLGIDHIVQLPADDESICRSIMGLLESMSHGKP